MGNDHSKKLERNVSCVPRRQTHRVQEQKNINNAPSGRHVPCHVVRSETDEQEYLVHYLLEETVPFISAYSEAIRRSCVNHRSLAILYTRPIFSHHALSSQHNL
ncbi:hypothetical protein RRG08_054500 [Elysia crispata]|uniref:Uncharacterized protein n=1 Tax=Elysia crispata TaxID=231223 RepID=A0AAE0YU44_9GAST|nr:hypothetical protein RRG08_054500 [Elysia crispata]